MDEYEEISKQKIFGLHGEFTVGRGSKQLRAVYIETKIRPGSEGVWDNVLASQLVPWREIFDIEKVTFDELLQRDLNDSRVAHDLIPYLIGENSSAARFFPPILVVLVPKKPEGAGIEKTYPKMIEEGGGMRFGNLFDFAKNTTATGGATPFGSLAFNPQKSAFIIVDGQHRAMAVLALHRQLTKSWTNSNFESYYKHIQVVPEDVKKLELPVCIVVFPDLQDGSDITGSGVTLDKACRELFLVVNRKAQPVSQARNLLLDDDDFAALMMRRTLSKFKGRTEDQDTLARIYSFRYSDSDDEGKAVQSGKLEYSSAVYLHKLHSIGSFGNPKGFTTEEPVDLSSGSHHRNPARPAEILLGTDLDKWQKLTRTSAKTHAPADVEIAVEKLGDLVDIPILSLFDTFAPFAAHNSTMRKLRTRLSEPTLRSDPIQNKAFTLLFEGSGSKEVFEEHIERLSNIKREWTEEGRRVSDYVLNQLNDAVAVQKAVQRHERDLKRQRACHLFNIRFDRFYPDPNSDSAGDQQALEQRARAIFDAVATQAFQIGYLTAVMTLVEMGLEPDAKYDDRKRLVLNVTDLVVTALNEFFKPGANLHDSFNGVVTLDRMRVFSTDAPGLRGLLGLSVSELNEKQWPFFRYAIYEIVFSKAARRGVVAWVGAQPEADRKAWVALIRKLSQKVEALREDYIGRALRAALKQSDFTENLRIKRAELHGAGKDSEEIEGEIRGLEELERKRVYDLAKVYITASVGDYPSTKRLNRSLDALVTDGGPAEDEDDSEGSALDPAASVLVEVDVDLAKIEASASEDSDEVGFDPAVANEPGADGDGPEA